MEAINYIEINEHGSAVIAGTRIHVEAIGFAHENGCSDQELLDWFKVTKAQLYSALAYFYEYRDELIKSEQDAVEIVERLSNNGRDKLRQLRDSQ